MSCILITYIDPNVNDRKIYLNDFENTNINYNNVMRVTLKYTPINGETLDTFTLQTFLPGLSKIMSTDASILRSLFTSAQLFEQEVRRLVNIGLNHHNPREEVPLNFSENLEIIKFISSEKRLPPVELIDEKSKSRRRFNIVTGKRINVNRSPISLF